MKLAKVKIHNFRSIEDVTIHFDHNCKILLGINEAGKTNILKALSLMDPNQATNRADIRHELPDEDSNITDAYVRFIFQLDQDEVKTCKSCLEEIVLYDENGPQPFVEVGGKNITFDEFFSGFKEVINEVNLYSGDRHKRLCYSLDLNDKTSISNKWKKVSDACPAGHKVKLRNGEERELKNYLFVNTKCLSEVVPPEYLEGLDLDGFCAALNNHLICRISTPQMTTVLWKYDEKNLIPSSVDIQSFKVNPNHCEPLRCLFELTGIEHIESAFSQADERGSTGITNLLKRVEDRATAHFQDVWKEFTHVRFSLSKDGTSIKIGVTEKNEYEFSQRSDGFKRFISFLLLISSKVKTGEMKDVLLLIDEPDTSLHPSGARYLRDELIKISDSNFVVFSTHSIFMIDKEKIDRHYLVKKISEKTTVSTADSSNIVDEEVLYQACGTTVFEVFKPLNIIFEGWRDKRLFEIALKKSSAKTKAALADIGRTFAYGVKDVARVSSIVGLSGREVMIVTDADPPALERKKDYVRSSYYGEWSTYKDLGADDTYKTAEDFIEQAHCLEVLKAVCAEKGHNFTNEPDFTANSRLKAIDTWLALQGIAEKTVKIELIDSFKDALFDKLEQKHILDAYNVIVDALAQRVVKGDALKKAA